MHAHHEARPSSPTRRSSDLRGNKHIASIEQRRHAPMRHRACEDYPPRRNLGLQQPLDFSMQTAASNKQKTHRQLSRNHFDRLRKLDHTVPWSKRADKTRHDFRFADPKLATNFITANSRTKQLRVHTIWINDDLSCRDSARLEVLSFDVRDHKNTRRGAQVQMFVSLQQIEASNMVPVAPDPDFRAVVL